MSKIIINGKSDGSLKAYKGGDEIAAMCAGSSVVYRKMDTGTQPEPPAEPKYLCFEPAGNADIEVAMSSMGSPGFSPVVYISGNGEDWTSWSLNPITIHPGSKLYLYGENNTFGLDTATYWKFYFYGQVRASGDVTTLLTKNGTRTLQTDYIFLGLFNNCTGLVTAPELPATTLTNYCYYNMFYGCTNLTTAPALPATTLADRCYSGMFTNCSSLATAPELPATTLAQHCYDYMFQGCTSLTTAPVLPATTLARSCYYHMFQGCTSLTTAPELPATTLAQSCYESMFHNCTSLTTAPELPATSLEDHCYDYMFYGCTNLNYIVCLALNPRIDRNRLWVNGVHPEGGGTFVKNAQATWERGNDGIPMGWTVQDYQG